MSTFVLVHGAWHGAWCWERVAPLLRRAGHEVVTPDLVGLGERAGELRPEVGLHTQAADLADLLGRHPRSIVVGHSYAGLVVREAADAVPDLIERLILLDGWCGPGELSLFDLAPDWFVEGLRQAAAARGEGWRIPAPAPALVGVTEAEDAAWLERWLTEQPLLSFEEPTALSGAVDAIPGTAIVTTPAGLPFKEMAESLGYRTEPIESGHDAMVTAPRALAEKLLATAASSSRARDHLAEGGAPTRLG